MGGWCIQSIMGPILESFGDILAVFMIFDDHQNVKGFEISRLDLRDNCSEAQWVKTSDIGDRMLFFDYDYNHLSARAHEFLGLKGNLIYFPHRWWYQEHLPYYDENKPQENRWRNKNVLGGYDIADKNIEIMRFPLEGTFSWLIPNLC